MSDLLSWLAAVAILAVLSYWHITERKTSRADPAHSSHTRASRRLIRTLPLAGGALLILQLIGMVDALFPVSGEIMLILNIVGHLIFWPSVVLAIWSRREIGTNWAHAADYQVLKGQELVTSGPYRYIRHPIYSAMLGVFIGAELIVTSWLVILAIPLAWFLIAQSRREEKLLLAAFGESYRTYLQRAGMFLPFTY